MSRQIRKYPYPVTRNCSFACLLAICLLASACSEQSSSTTSVQGNAQLDPIGQSGEAAVLGLDIPQALLQSRAIDTDQLEPLVTTTANGQINNFELQRVSDTQWSGTIDVPASTTVTLDLEWIETFQGLPLVLATFQNTFPTGVDPVSITLNEMDYFTAIDDDNDGVSNLDERIANTSPFDTDSVPAPEPGPTDVMLQIPLATASAPQIDGLGAAFAANELQLIGEWAEAAPLAPNNTSGTDLFIDSLMISSDNGNDSIPFHTWTAVHDGTFLYILVLVDDQSDNHGDSEVLGNDDSIEIYIDGDNSNFTSYGDADDRYFRIGLLDADGNSNNSANAAARIEQGLNSAPLPPNIFFATGPGTGPLSIVNTGERQDVYEVQLELAAFGISANQPFGIEVQINDDDGGGTRDTKWGWNHPVRRAADFDLTQANPAFMGTVQLQ